MSYTSPIPSVVGVNQKTVLQPLNQKQAPPTRPYYPSITNISTEPRPDGSQAVYVQTFLIDAITQNKKGWKVSFDNPVDFDRRVAESINHPLVLFPTQGSRGELIYDHPIAPISTLEAAADPVRANIEFQKKFTIGHARFFKKIRQGVWAATYEITEPKAKKFFMNAKDKGIRLYTSPYIVRPSSEPNRNNIKEWALIHNAIVSQPAYGEGIASIKDVCIAAKGDPYQCQSLFASITAEEELPEFDVEEALSFLTSQITQEPDITDMTQESASMMEPQQQSVVSTQQPTDSTVVTKTIPHSQITDLKTISEEQKEPKPQEQNDPSKEPNKEGSELDQLKAQIENLTKQNQTLQEKYAYDTRKANIEKIFSSIVSTVYADPKTGVVDEKEYNAEINRLTKSNHSFDEIQELAQARFVIAQYQQQGTKRPERASLTSHNDETQTFNYTKMDTNKTDCGCPNKLGFSVFKQTLGGF